MATSEAYAPFEVVVVPFPYSDRLAEKRRPALVVSGPPLAGFGVLWLAMITSAENPAWACDVPVVDLARAGLPAASVVRPAKIACVEPGRILRRAGVLDAPTARRVAREMRRFLATAR
ncbi:hypothetical protein BH11GEM1_BH11GEM1_15990 [soil metagenome]